MTEIAFTVTFDYRCPFARIAHKHVLAGLRAGAPWTVTWAAHSLKQDHIDEGEPPVWDRPEVDSGMQALEVGLVARDLAPDHFFDVHEALFDARHVESRDLRETEVLRLVAQGLSNRDIAGELYISENTVKNHVRNILEKLHLHSRMEAVVYAVREKLLDLR